MHGSRTFPLDLALVLCVAAVTSVLFKRLRQPVMLGYMLAGVIVGPHIPIPLFVDDDRIRSLAELGVILVMFCVGLEFSIRQLVSVLPTAGVVGAIQVGTMMWLGNTAGRAFGWSVKESLFTGAILAISSTMVVSKVFEGRNVDRKLSETVFGVLIVQDLAAVVLIAIVSTFAAGARIEASVLAGTMGELLGFLFLVGTVGFVLVPRLVRGIDRLESEETLLVASIGLCFGFALLANAAGHSVALGGFVAGSVIAESGLSEKIERLVAPIRDIFAAVFFVTVGMVLDPRAVWTHRYAVLALTGVVIVGMTLSVAFGALLSGRDVRTSIRAGLSLAQIGEFSFVIAAIGVDSHAVRRFLYPVAIAVAVLTTLAAPALVGASDAIARRAERAMPKPMQNFVSLYGSWLEQLRGRRKDAADVARRRRLVLVLALDAAVVAAITVAGFAWKGAIARRAARELGFSADFGPEVVVVGAAVLALPFLYGIVRTSGALASRIVLAAAREPVADGVVPEGDAEAGLAAGPRRAMVVVVQLAALTAIGLPLGILVQQFLPPLVAAIGFALVLGALVFALYRTATSVQTETRATAERFLDALTSTEFDASTATEEERDTIMSEVGPLLRHRIAAESPALGKTLIELDLRARSGASVLAIMRDHATVADLGREPLRAGDVLAVAGSSDAVAAAVEILEQG